MKGFVQAQKLPMAQLDPVILPRRMGQSGEAGLLCGLNIDQPLTDGRLRIRRCKRLPDDFKNLALKTQGRGRDRR